MAMNSEFKKKTKNKKPTKQTKNPKVYSSHEVGSLPQNNKTEHYLGELHTGLGRLKG